MLYPLRFEPIFRQYPWGGRRLGTVLGKDIGSEGQYAESWEVVDHGPDQSVVLAGSRRGMTLHQLVTEEGRPLFGQHHPQRQFPLLFKYLDAHRSLSVQVHPTDEQAAELSPPDLGKTEAWVVVDAEPESVLYAGLKRGVDRELLAREVERGTCELCLYKIYPRPGDCILIPAGTVHALGKGLLIAEIQQASDTTYRLFDWNRRDAEGNSRPLHIQQSLDTINFDFEPADPQPAQLTTDPHTERLVECDKFVLDRRTLTSPTALPGDNRFHLLSVLSGSIHVSGDAIEQPLGRGQTILVPADVSDAVMTPAEQATVLDMFLP